MAASQDMPALQYVCDSILFMVFIFMADDYNQIILIGYHRMNHCGQLQQNGPNPSRILANICHIV